MPEKHNQEESWNRRLVLEPARVLAPAWAKAVREYLVLEPARIPAPASAKAVREHLVLELGWIPAPASAQTGLLTRLKPHSQARWGTCPGAGPGLGQGLSIKPI